MSKKAPLMAGTAWKCPRQWVSSHRGYSVPPSDKDQFPERNIFGLGDAPEQFKSRYV